MSDVSNRMVRFHTGVERLREFKTPEAIAAFLIDLGYQGSLADRRNDVVANFLRDCIGDPDASLSVNPVAVLYDWADDDKPHGNKTVIECGVKYESAFGEFLAQFDKEDYPELVAAEEPEETEVGEPAELVPA